MSNFKTLLGAAFSSLSKTPEEIAAIELAGVTKMVEAVKSITEMHIEELKVMLTNFDADDWLVFTECGSVGLGLKAQRSPLDPEGSIEAVMKDTGEIWVRIILDNVFMDGFEPMYLKGSDRAVLSLLDTYREEVKTKYGLTNMDFSFNGTAVLDF